MQLTKELNPFMNYRDRYVTVELTDEEFKQINEIVSEHKNFKVTEIENVRECEVAFINSQHLYDIVMSYATRVNEAANWFFDLDFVEPLQVTKYTEGHRYDWHQDESEWHPFKRGVGKIRKISFTLLLNDDFEGGEFHLINQEVPLKSAHMIFFHSDDLHMVAPVTSGTRLSLVGWIQGLSLIHI